jgi:hypothetical protein
VLDAEIGWVALHQHVELGSALVDSGIS